VSHSGFAGSRGRATSRPLSGCGPVFVTVNGALAVPESSSVTLSLAVVTVKLGARFDTGKSGQPPIPTVITKITTRTSAMIRSF
jgi:hypothetical protein